LVLSVIQRFNNRGENVDDLFQVGCIGLMKAIDNFDLSQNVKFSTYAVPMIIGEIRRYLRDNNPIRVSRSLRDIAYKALQVRDALTSKNGQEPTIAEIAAVLNIDREEIVFALDAIQEPISLFEPIYHDGGDPIFVMDQISDDKDLDNQWLEGISIREAMSRLNDREKEILKMRFFDGRTQMEVAEEIGISQAQVSRLEKTALKNIRRYIGDERAKE
jgi:RNA polymerase sporulation-specific sigma factor